MSGGLIRVELNDFYGPLYTEPQAHVIAQAWVRTLQDSLGVRDDVLITLQGALPAVRRHRHGKAADQR